MVPVMDRPKTRRALKAPFRLRLKAWWHGHELFLKRRAQAAGPLGQKDDLRRRVTGYRDPERPWETPRVRMLQAVWGEGFTGPGGPDHALELVKPLGLGPEMSMLHIGAGLGGPARAFVEAFGVWVAGVECDHELAEAGMSLSTLAGMAKRAPITPLQLQRFELTPNSLDVILANEILFAVIDKHRALREIEQALRVRGQFLFTDYVLNQRGQEDDPALQAWAKKEPLTPHLWTAREYARILAEYKLDIRITEDVTDTYRSLALQGWANYTEAVSETELDPEVAACLVQEADLWTRRIAAFNSGLLRVYRIYARKKAVDKMLSDW